MQADVLQISKTNTTIKANQMLFQRQSSQEYYNIKMMAELAEANRRQQNRHRNRIIEDAYNSCEHRTYKMPRSLPLREGSIDSIDSIPSIYNLHAQNQPGLKVRLLPVKLLITLKQKQSASKQQNSTTVTTKKATLAIMHPATHLAPSRRLQCTLSLSKNPSKQLLPAPKSWLCCPKDQSLDQFETRELSTKEDQRLSKALCGLLPSKNTQGRGRRW